MKNVYIIIFLFLIVSATGCTRPTIIKQEDYKEFIEDMILSYKYIDDGLIEYLNGPQSLHIIYTVNSSENNYEACFEATREFLLESSTIGKLINDDGKPYEILEIVISFRSEDYNVNYRSNYYNDGPNGYQDNRYWTDDNINGFEDWSTETILAE